MVETARSASSITVQQIATLRSYTALLDCSFRLGMVDQSHSNAVVQLA